MKAVRGTFFFYFSRHWTGPQKKIWQGCNHRQNVQITKDGHRSDNGGWRTNGGSQLEIKKHIWKAPYIAKYPVSAGTRPTELILKTLQTSLGSSVKSIIAFFSRWMNSFYLSLQGSPCVPLKLLSFLFLLCGSLYLFITGFLFNISWDFYLSFHWPTNPVHLLTHSFFQPSQWPGLISNKVNQILEEGG